MNFWFNLDNTEEPINNINYINNEEMNFSKEEIELIKSVLKVFTNDLLTGGSSFSKELYSSNKWYD